MESEIYIYTHTSAEYWLTFPSEEAKSMAGGEGSVRRYRLAMAIFVRRRWRRFTLSRVSNRTYCNAWRRRLRTPAYLPNWALEKRLYVAIAKLNDVVSSFLAGRRVLKRMTGRRQSYLTSELQQKNANLGEIIDRERRVMNGEIMYDWDFLD